MNELWEKGISHGINYFGKDKKLLLLLFFYFLFFWGVGGEYFAYETNTEKYWKMFFGFFFFQKCNKHCKIFLGNYFLFSKNIFQKLFYSKTNTP
jgi:hypothetical protein